MKSRTINRLLKSFCSLSPKEKEHRQPIPLMALIFMLPSGYFWKGKRQKKVGFVGVAGLTDREPPWPASQNHRICTFGFSPSQTHVLPGCLHPTSSLGIVPTQLKQIPFTANSSLPGISNRCGCPKNRSHPGLIPWHPHHRTEANQIIAPSKCARRGHLVYLVHSLHTIAIHNLSFYTI